MNTSKSKLAHPGRLAVGVLAATLIGTALPQSVLIKTNHSVLFDLINSLVPAIERFAALSSSPEYIRFALCLNWLFIPVLVATAFWNRSIFKSAQQDLVLSHFRKADGSANFALYIGIIACGWMALSDCMGWKVSFYTGIAFTAHPETWLNRLMHSSSFASGIFVWMFSIGQATIYFLLVSVVFAFFAKVFRPVAVNKN